MPTDIMFEQVETASDQNGTSAQAAIKVGGFGRRNALVLVTAHGSAHYQGPTANAGIILTLSDERVEIRDDSFEGESSNITFNSAASHMFILKPDESRTVTAQVSPYGAGGRARNRRAQARLHVMAIDVI